MNTSVHANGKSENSFGWNIAPNGMNEKRTVPGAKTQNTVEIIHRACTCVFRAYTMASATDKVKPEIEIKSTNARLYLTGNRGENSLMLGKLITIILSAEAMTNPAKSKESIPTFL